MAIGVAGQWWQDDVVVLVQRTADVNERRQVPTVGYIEGAAINRKAKLQLSAASHIAYDRGFTSAEAQRE